MNVFPFLLDALDDHASIIAEPYKLTEIVFFLQSGKCTFVSPSRLAFLRMYFCVFITWKKEHYGEMIWRGKKEKHKTNTNVARETHNKGLCVAHVGLIWML